MNRLANAASLYLRQHAEHPVDWWPWGQAAFAHAQAVGRPILVSVGYAACHWCHVMARESFANPTIAAELNRGWVCIKVDREEHPDVDAYYSNALAVQGEPGGWPLTAFCFSDGRPFYLGTYFPDTPRHDRPSLLMVASRLLDAFAHERDKLDENATALAEGLRDFDGFYRGAGAVEAYAEGADARVPPLDLALGAAQQLAQRCDAEFGGLRGHHKFPSAPLFALLTRGAAAATREGTSELSGTMARATAPIAENVGRPAAENLWMAAVHWAAALVRGGIYDHLGGGIARYATDPRWRVPHFEKMLADQGQLLMGLAWMYAATSGGVAGAALLPAATWQAAMRGTLDYVTATLAGPRGGFMAAQSAESDAREGAYYLWSHAELVTVLGSEGAAAVAAAFGVRAPGDIGGKSVLAGATTRQACAGAAVAPALTDALVRLAAHRATRQAPQCDPLQPTGANALLVRGAVAMARVLGETGEGQTAAAVAQRTGQWLWANLAAFGTLPQLGDAAIDSVGAAEVRVASCEAYAQVIAAFIDLAALTGDAEWLVRAVVLYHQAEARFFATIDGVPVWYAFGQEAGISHRAESNQDGATPAAAGLMVENQVRLGLLLGAASWLAQAERYVATRLHDRRAAAPMAVPGLYMALLRYLTGGVVVITSGTGATPLLAAAQRAILSEYDVAPACPSDTARVQRGPAVAEAAWRAAYETVANGLAAVWQGKAADRNGIAQAYLCAHQRCTAPIPSPEQLANALA